MPNINKANRQVCDVDLRELSTMKPFLFFDTANTTTAGLTSEDTYAMAKGAKKIGFSNPIDATMTIEAQVFPFKFYSLLSDGTIKTDAIRAMKELIKCTVAGELAIPTDSQPGTVYVFEEGEVGNKEIKGAFVAETNKFTATTTSEIAANKTYEVTYLISKSAGVERISFNNKSLPKDYYVTMKTVEKDETGLLTPYELVAYKAKPKRNLSLSFSSTGEPVSVSVEFSLLEDKNGNILDMIEITE